MDLTTASPVQIDTVLAEIMNKQAALMMRFDSAKSDLHRAAGDEQTGSWGHRSWGMNTEEAIEAAQAKTASERIWEAREAEQALARWEDLQAQARVLREQAAPLNAEFTRRGGWTRAFLATSSNGHIHSSRACSTCRETTQFFWFVDLSGHDEAEIVTKAGSDACTVCYPSAPVNDLKRPRSIFSDDEVAAQQARERREAEKAERLAKKIANGLTEDGSEFVVAYPEAHHHRDRTTGGWVAGECKERFKTERAAVQWMVQYISWGDTLDGSEKSPAYEQIIEAVAAKHGLSIEEVREDVANKVVAKIKRDSRH